MKRLLENKVFIWLLAALFLIQNAPVLSYAQGLNLPVAGSVVSLSPNFQPTLLQGITIHPEDPFQFDFIISPGDDKLGAEEFKKESEKLIKYFLASLTVPEKEMWVNLSPYEKERIVPDGFGQTEMGRDMLAQDYILKQLSASLMHPDTELGKAFWEKFYKTVQEKYGNVEVPVDTFNKVWIMPEKIVVHENKTSVFVVESRLKVMLEEDYLALNKNSVIKESQEKDDGFRKISKEIMKELLIPAIEKEVNEGKNFATIRQIFNSLILATWYKQNLKKSLLSQVYIDQHKTEGVAIDPKANQMIYDQYVEAFKKGVYNSVKEDYDPITQEIVSRKYFSGGVVVEGVEKMEKASSANLAMLSRKLVNAVAVGALLLSSAAKADDFMGDVSQSALLMSARQTAAVQTATVEVIKKIGAVTGPYIFNSKDFEDKDALMAKVANIAALFGKSLDGRPLPQLHLTNYEASGRGGLARGDLKGKDVPIFGIRYNFRGEDPASLAKPSDVGGIDFNPENMNIEVQNKSDVIQFNFDPQKYKDMTINGLSPVIINIAPLTNVPLLLGANPASSIPADNS